MLLNLGSLPFYVLDAATHDTVYRGMLTPLQTWSYSGEAVSRADFSSLTVPGRYVVNVPGIGSSFAFDIKARVHEKIAAGVLKGYYYQRASTSLVPALAGNWSRAAGHPDTAVLIHPSAASVTRPANSTIAASMGW